MPGDRGLSVNLALSLALSGQYGEAVAVLGPIALGPGGTPSERQTLVLIHMLQGDSRDRRTDREARPRPAIGAAQLAYYDTLRLLSPEARSARDPVDLDGGSESRRPAGDLTARLRLLAADWSGTRTYAPILALSRKRGRVRALPAGGEDEAPSLAAGAEEARRQLSP